MHVMTAIGAMILIAYKGFILNKNNSYREAAHENR